MYRYKEEIGLTTDHLVVDIDSEWIKEDEKAEKTRDLTDYGFYARYNAEAELIVQLMKNHGKVKTVLELGSGPGLLAQKIQEKYPIKMYHLVDGKGAQTVFNKRGYKGDFYIRNMMNDFEMVDFNWSYDFIILNDFLEHIRNPSIILTKLYNFSIETTKLFISVPNWRCGHVFFYPGLFDYDNFYKFVEIHKFKFEDCYGSNMRVKNYLNVKLDSESTLPESMISSWNWYFLFNKNV